MDQKAIGSTERTPWDAIFLLSETPLFVKKTFSQTRVIFVALQDQYDKEN